MQGLQGKNITSTIWHAYRNGEHLGGCFETAELISFETYKERREKYRKEASLEEYDNWCLLVKFYNDNNAKAGGQLKMEDEEDDEGIVGEDTGIPKEESDVFDEEQERDEDKQLNSGVQDRECGVQDASAENEDAPSLRSDLIKRIRQPEAYIATVAIFICLISLGFLQWDGQ